MSMLDSGSNIDGKLDGCASGPTNNASSMEANSSTGGCCTQRRPDGRGKVFRNVFQHEKVLCHNATVARFGVLFATSGWPNS